MEQPKVNVLLATYNGEKFIRNQLDSIIAQTYDNIDIYIRDDGSSDQTVSVVKKYMEENTSNKNIYLIDNGGVNLRCPASFYEIFRKCRPAKYYSLCDQDDVWYPEKIQWAVERLEKEDNHQIMVYYSASDYSDEDGNVIRKSPLQKDKLELTDVLYYTPGSGFTMLINEMARQKLILDVDPGKELHDRWLIRGGVCFGKVLYESRSTASHIRHESAVTAGDAGNVNLLLNFIKEELLGDDAKKEKEFLGHFLHVFQDSLREEQIKPLRLFSRENTVIGWFQKVFYPRRLRTRLGGEIALRMMFLIGKI